MIWQLFIKIKKDGKLYMETYLDNELLYEKMDDRSMNIVFLNNLFLKKVVSF